MGKAADQRRRARMKKFVVMANQTPQVFEKEWNKLLHSWGIFIQKQAGILRNEEDQFVKPMFDIVDEAMTILRDCGEEVFLQYGQETYDYLTHICCRSISLAVDKRMYRPNSYIRVKHERWL